MNATAAKSAPFIDGLDATAGTLPGNDLPWLSDLRARGRDCYADLGLPTQKREDWKYTNLNRLRRAGFLPAAPDTAVESLPLGNALALDADRVVLVNGRFRADLSDLPAGGSIEASGLTDLLQSDPDTVEPLLGQIADVESMPLAALNTAGFADGVVLRLRAGTTAERPVHIVSLGAAGETPLLFHPRVLIVAEEGSQGCVVESHIGLGDGAYFSNSVVEIAVRTRAALQHYKLQNEHPAAFHIAATQAVLDEGAMYESFVLQVGARLARNEIRTRLDAGRIDCHVNGAYLLQGDQHADNTTFIDHAAAGSNSRELYKGVIDGKARGVFQGKILVRQDAQKTDGHQLNRALLLSREAEIDSKPELEIYADDVKCSHGASAGELDDDALFYLRSRGIDEATARSLLVEAFIGEAIDSVDYEPARDAFRQVINGWLADRQPAGGGNGDKE
ncbi:MAG: Fe-S cluster assembly protein SufD [Alphaproteobacteria bacterium]|nr:Fe-S cluster assembly protein SufD [Alphaproteobacteria bacterium]